MNKRQINKARMYFATDLVLDNHQELISPFPELISAHQSIKEKISLIDIYRQVQEANNSGLTVSKFILRADLIKLINKFDAALLAHATIIKDNELKTQASYSNTELLRAADPTLYDIGYLLYNLANPIRPVMERFFVTETDFNQMESVLTSFRGSIPQKRVALGTSKVSTGNIGETFNAIDLLLKEEVDVLIQPFQFTQIDFYNKYKSARTIVDTGGNRKKPEEEPPVA